MWLVCLPISVCLFVGRSERRGCSISRTSHCPLALYRMQPRLYNPRENVYWAWACFIFGVSLVESGVASSQVSLTQPPAHNGENNFQESTPTDALVFFCREGWRCSSSEHRQDPRSNNCLTYKFRALPPRYLNLKRPAYTFRTF